MKTNKDLVINFIIAIIVYILLNIYVISPYIINGISMENTLNNGDIVLSLNKNLIGFFSQINDDFLRNKIAVIKNNNELLIKRIAGVSGDTIIIGNDFYIDTIIVPNNKIYVLGDNFRNSYDSRNMGFIDYSDIKGIAIMKYYSMPYIRVH